MRILIPVLVLLASACTISPDPTPINTMTLSGNYQRIAACAYDRLSAGKRHNWKFTNLQGVDKVIVGYAPQESLGTHPEMMFWEASFLKASESTTRVEIRVAGPLFAHHHERFWPTVQACAT